MLVKATAKSVRVSAKKAQEVAALVNRRSVEDALVILEHTQRRAATPIIKVIKSARANATNNHNMLAEDLRIVSLQVNPAGGMKRYRAGAKGRSKPYIHPLTHIEVHLSGSIVKPAPKAATKATTKKAAAETKNNKPSTKAKES